MVCVDWSELVGRGYVFLNISHNMNCVSPGRLYYSENCRNNHLLELCSELISDDYVYPHGYLHSNNSFYGSRAGLVLVRTWMWEQLVLVEVLAVLRSGL